MIKNIDMKKKETLANNAKNIINQKHISKMDNTSRLNELVEKIKTTLKETESHFVHYKEYQVKYLENKTQVGKYLIEAKDLLPPKKFGEWCRFHFDDTTQRTLNNYMTLAKHTKKLSKTIKTVRQALKESINPALKRKTARETDFYKVKKNLNECVKILNTYPDLISCNEADLVCEQYDKISVWVEDYRARSSKNRLNKLNDEAFDLNNNITIDIGTGKEELKQAA
jgi:hypothetical protein